MNICLFAASSDNLEEGYYRDANVLGALIAQHGDTLVYGGGRGGLMGACAEGVFSNGGSVVGIAPRFFDEGDTLRKEDGTFLFTQTMSERKAKMAELADAFLILPGGVGTFEELFEVLTLKMLGCHNKPMVFVNLYGYYDDLLHMLRVSVEKKFTAESCSEMFLVCSDSTEAFLEARRQYESMHLTGPSLRR